MFDIETFIEAVKERQALYYVYHKNYNRKDIRMQLWEEIGQIMYPDWDSLDVRDKTEKVTIMQKKWKSLKDCFNREIRNQKAGDPKKLRKKYEFYDRLSFLLRKRNPSLGKPTGPLKGVKIKLENNEEAEVRFPTQSINAKTIHPQNQIPIPEGNAKKRKPEEVPMSFKPKPQRRVEEAEDSDRLFLLSFVNDLRKLPLTTKYWVKMKFSEIMHQAAMSLDEHQDTEYTNNSMDYEQEVGSPVSGYLADYPDEESPQDLNSSEIYNICQE